MPVPVWWLSAVTGRGGGTSTTGDASQCIVCEMKLCASIVY